MRFAVSLILLLSFATHCKGVPFKFLSKDSLQRTVELDMWLYQKGDDTSRAQRDYPDSDWELVNTNTITKKGKTGTPPDFFEGVGWFRLHLQIDSTLLHTPVSISLDHYGASEVYLNGQKLRTNGKLVKDSFVYVDPSMNLITFVFEDTGRHVLAVRYVNYNWKKLLDRFEDDDVGFFAQMGMSEQLFNDTIESALSITFIFLFFFGVFLAFALQHLFLFLFRRKNKAHLFFSIFTFSLAGFFLIIWIIYTADQVETQMVVMEATTWVMCLAFFGFSGLINEMFSKKKLRFGIITGLIALSLILTVLDVNPVGGNSYLIILLTVITEALIVVTRAIFKRMPGAGVIGTGILMFSLFVVFLTGLGYMGDSIHLTGWAGALIVLLMAGAILSIPISMAVFLARENALTNKNLERQLEQVQQLSEQAIQQELEKKRLLESRKEELERLVAQRTTEVISQKQELEEKHEELKEEKHKSDALLLNILPMEVAEELKVKGSSEARYFDEVSVLFTDFVDFTKASERMSPQELVNELDTCFKAFDDILSTHQIEKIKTIGDAYLAVCGLPNAMEDHAVRTVQAALEMLAFMEQRKRLLGDKTFDIRLGIHSGPVVAGIVGIKKFAYDIWGDTVNTAARMEQSSESGKINISQNTYDLIKHRFNCTYRGEVEAKNKGLLQMYFVETRSIPEMVENQPL